MTRTHDLRTKLKRQTEILGLCTDPESRFRIADLSDLFHCEDLTIKRDLQDLRASGIDIHSIPRKGIRIEGGLSRKKLEQLIHQYAVLASPHTVEKATSILVRKQGALALRNFVILQLCIDQTLLAKVDYEKTSGSITRGREIAPARIFRADNQWRVIGENEGRLKQFLLSKMASVQITDRSFTPLPPGEIDALFLHSFRSFLGTDKISVRLRLSKRWAEIIRPRQLLEDAVVIERPDRSIDVTFFVNSLEEIAGWVAGRGEGVTVVEPVKLRVMVIDLARGSLRNYRSEIRQ